MQGLIREAEGGGLHAYRGRIGSRGQSSPKHTGLSGRPARKVLVLQGWGKPAPLQETIAGAVGGGLSVVGLPDKQGPKQIPGTLNSWGAWQQSFAPVLLGALGSGRCGPLPKADLGQVHRPGGLESQGCWLGSWGCAWICGDPLGLVGLCSGWCE